MSFNLRSRLIILEFSTSRFYDRKVMYTAIPAWWIYRPSLVNARNALDLLLNDQLLHSFLMKKYFKHIFLCTFLIASSNRFSGNPNKFTYLQICACSVISVLCLIFTEENQRNKKTVVEKRAGLCTKKTPIQLCLALCNLEQTLWTFK